MRAFEQDYAAFFKEVTGISQGPYSYQERLAEGPWPDLLDIPTGLGKTVAVVLAWLWKTIGQDQGTPLRLVYCLPMRVLVEQTFTNADFWLKRAVPYFQQAGRNPPSLHLLMGGEADALWVQKPESPAMIIGTQDMLLSRALMRGYGMSRYQWPMHFALLHNDALWVFDEIQIMGAGLATAAQLEGLRRHIGCARAGRSLWVSATLNPAWLDTVDMRPYTSQLIRHALEEHETQSPPVRERREAVKHLSQAKTSLTAANSKAKAKSYARDLAQEVLQTHKPGSTTLVVLNTVDRAQSVMQALHKEGPQAELVLVHARFRPAERKELEKRIISVVGEQGRIVVATQAVEAGVDMTSGILFTELAPWSSLVQRFGRCNRYGEVNGQRGAEVLWIDIHEESKLEPPYQADDLAASRAILKELHSASAVHLPETTQAAPESLVLRRKDLLELFNTDPDLSGFDIDVSRYIRDGNEMDVQVFWRELEKDAAGRPVHDNQPRPDGDELCRASLSQFLAYHKRIRTKQGRAFVWDALGSVWSSLGQDIRPGMTIMLDAALGGYDSQLGFLPDHTRPVSPLPVPEDTRSPDDYGSDSWSVQRIAVRLTKHLHNACEQARALCTHLNLPPELSRPVTTSARNHDLGKAHPAFQNMLLSAMAGSEDAAGVLWAKSGPGNGGRSLYYVLENGDKQPRPLFRHELASMLAWLQTSADDPQADLIAYLIAAHHGKVRMGLRAQPGEAEPPDPNRLFARGVWDGDLLPAVDLDGRTMPELSLHLDIMRLGEGPLGPSWTARTQKLLSEHGPFTLAWLETIVRLADQRASRLEQEDDHE